MKALKVFAAVCCLMMMMAFAGTLPGRVERFVEKVEKNCVQWDTEDWNQAQRVYSGFMEEFQESYDSFSQDEKESLYKSFGRYKGMYFRHKVGKAEDKMKEIGETIPSFIEGFISAFEEKTE